MTTQRAQQVLFDRAGRLVLAVTLLALLALVGCSSPPAVNPAALEAGQPAIASNNAVPAAGLSEKTGQPASDSVGDEGGKTVASSAEEGGEDGVKWIFKTGSKIDSTPAVFDGVVYFGSDDEYLYAVDAQSGKTIWQFDAGHSVDSSPVVAGDTIYFGSGNKNFYALDRHTGQEVWRFDAGHSVISPPVLVDGMVCFGTGDGRLYALDRQTGQEIWQFETGDIMETRPAAVEGVVYVGTGSSYRKYMFGDPDDHLYALDARTGREKWRFQAGGRFATSPAVARGIVYAGNTDGFLYAVDAQTGQQVWRFETVGPVYSSPAVAGGVVYFGSQDKHLYALDNQTGQELWRFKTGGPLKGSTPAIAGGLVYVASTDGYLYALDSQTGREVWKIVTIAGVFPSPVVEDGVVYFTKILDLYAVVTPDRDKGL